MMKLNATFLLGLELLALLLLASCQPEVERETAVINTPTTVPTRTAVPTQTVLPPTATIEATPLLTATATQTPVVTLTPLPTFAPDELETAVADLLANPMNCDVPCWWGAIPGKTTDHEVQQFLTQYGFTDLQSNDPEHLEIRISHDETGGQPYFYIRYSFEDGMLKIVFSEEAPSLDEVLRNYGQPDEIWLTVVDFEGLLVRLNLVYLQKGMAVGFVVDGYMQDDLVKGCFADEETGLLRLVEPNTATSYKEFSPIFDLDRRYLPLEEATSLTMDEFMERFSDPNQPQCIETPIELWE